MKEIIARRYAKALIRIGEEDGNYELYGQELKAFEGVMGISPQLGAVMENPIYDKDQKKALFRAINLKLRLSPIVVNFILLLIDKRRLGYFAEIVRCYGLLADEVAGKARAKVISPVPIPNASIAAIQKKLASMTGKEVIVSVEEDPGLIGGVVTQIGDIVYDGSIRTQLNKMKETLMKG
jgi:F-type H+-transporting ATPase subunit delta